MANNTDNTLRDFARNSQAGRDLERLVGESKDVRDHYKKERHDQKNLPLLERQRDILIHYLYTRDLDFLRSVPSEHETRARLAKVIQQGDVERLAVNIREAIEAVITQLYHYGLLQPLMDESKEFITDIWVFGTYGILYRERGQNRWFLDDKGERLHFSSHEELRQFVERKFGSDFNLDLSAPSVNAIFPDGSRILYREKACGYSAWINGKYELFLNEPMLIIRRFGHAYLLDELMETGMFTPRMQAYLELIPRLHEKFLIGGATGVGKSTLQNAMLAYLSQTEVTGMLEDTPDAKIPGGFYVRFYTQEANGEGKGEITIARNLYDAKRANFQNVIVNEMRDGATGMRATDVAMMTSGSFGSTIHAVTIENMINVYTSMLMSAPERPNRVYASELFVAAFQKLISVEIVHQKPMITAIGEVMGMVGERVQWQPVFERQYKARRVLFHGLSEATIERAYKYDIEIPASLQQPGEETF